MTDSEPDDRTSRAWTCRIVSFWGATRQPRQNSNRSADTPTPCAASDSSGGGGFEDTTRHGEGDAATHQGDAGPEVSAGDDQLQVSLSHVWLSAVSLSQVSAVAGKGHPRPAAVSTKASPPQAASRKGRRRRVHETEWRVRLDRLSRGRGMGPKAGSGKDLATTSKHARAQSTGQRGGMPFAPRFARRPSNSHPNPKLKPKASASHTQAKGLATSLTPRT